MAVWIGLLATGGLATAADQRLELAPGWNLISIQVRGDGADGSWSVAQLTNRFVGPTNSAPAPSGLQIWAYETTTGNFTGQIPSIADFPDNASLTHLKPGRGYWLRADAKATLALTGPAVTGTVDLPAGSWSLFGLIGVTEGADRDFELAAVFGTRLADVEELWTWSPELKRYVGYKPTARPALLELTHVRPGRGYWIRPRAGIRLDASLETLLPPDVDLPPLADRTGANADAELPRGDEDAPFDLDRDKRLDSARTQRTLMFEAGISSQTFSIRRSAGSEIAGLSQWSLSADVPWIEFSPTNGVVGTETDGVVVTVNRAGLLPREYEGKLFVDTPSGTVVLTNRMVVPTAEGDYRGAATLTRVNGKDIPLGKVDLHLSLFDDPPEAGQPTGRFFRGVINRDEALLFPQDVLLRGVFYAGHDFTLTTTFTMPTGDRNMPPYETFRTPRNDVEREGRNFGDIDENGNGRLDNLNPFPFPVRRQVTLLGRRVDDGVLTGTYIEALPDLIAGTSVYLEGTFRLERQRLTPSRKTAFIGRSTGDPLTIGGSALSEQRSPITVANPVTVQAVQVRLDVSHPSASNLVYRLISPGGQSAALVQSNGVWVAFGLEGSQEAGKWELEVAWDPSTVERGRLVGWELSLVGLNLRTVTATIQRAEGNTVEPFPGARLTLIGGNVPRETNAPGATVQFTGLSEDSYVLRAEYPGYRPTQVAFTLSNTNLVLEPLVLRPYTNTFPELVAEPFVGTAPLFSRQVLRVSPRYVRETFGTLADAVWTLGNGVRITNSGPAALLAVENVFTNGGHFVNTVRLRGTNGTAVTLTNRVHAHSQVPNLATTALQAQPTFIQPIAFIGSGSALPTLSTGQTTNLIRLPEGSTIARLSRTGTTLATEGRDVAAFDYYLTNAPSSGTGFTHPPILVRQLDFFYQAKVGDSNTWTRMRPGAPPLKPSPAMLAEYPGLTNDTWQPYTKQPPSRFRLEVTLGGTVFGPFEFPRRAWADETARVGDLILQTGRIEP